jgi:hypothetical protein
MKYKNKFLASAIALGLGLSANAQNNNFTINGLGRSIISQNDLGGNLTKDNNSFQQSGTAGYNLFDLQTNLNVDSNFQAMAILRAKSPFGALFGQGTTFDFRQFAMMGKIGGFKYEIGDIRVQLSPYTVFNNDVIPGRNFENALFSMRREIIEYENFNLGNTWLLQGLAGQHFFKFNEEGKGLGVYAFTSRNVPTNDGGVPDRLLSGGNIELRLSKDLKLGVNAVSMYDVSPFGAQFKYLNNVGTGYINYFRENSKMYLLARFEGGMSGYKFTENPNTPSAIDSAYNDGFVDVDARLGLKNAKIKFDANFRSVGVLFSSPSAQTRRINITAPMSMFNLLSSAQEGIVRQQLLFDRFTSEDIYNSGITANLMAFLPYYNNTIPYGKATPNRIGGEIAISTDTSNHVLDASVKGSFFTEVQGEGGDPKRQFMLVNGGTNVHLGKMLDMDRILDINFGARYENTTRNQGALVDLNSTLIDAGLTFELVKKLDFLAGMKSFTASGNEFIAKRNAFNAIVDYDEIFVDMNEMIYTVGIRARFNKHQMFTLNYNFTDMQNKFATANNYNFGQVFLHYRGIF